MSNFRKESELALAPEMVEDPPTSVYVPRANSEEDAIRQRARSSRRMAELVEEEMEAGDGGRQKADTSRKSKKKSRSANAGRKKEKVA